METKLIKEGESYYNLFIDDTHVGGAWVGNTNIVMPKMSMKKRDRVIMSFNILPEFRNKGYAKILIQELIKEETLNNTKTLRLGVQKENEYAIKTYSSAGFKIIGEVTDSMHYMLKKI
jgi:ribosomal protein S18 acetylase RimI-like enzyme